MMENKTKFDILILEQQLTDGSGIGLYNVKSTIERMNGSISVESDGLVYYIYNKDKSNEIRIYKFFVDRENEFIKDRHIDKD